MSLIQSMDSGIDWKQLYFWYVVGFHIEKLKKASQFLNILFLDISQCLF